jgi:Ca-activated chloride channel family protein
MLLPLPWVIKYYLPMASKNKDNDNNIVIKFPRIEKLQAALDFNSGNQSKIKVINAFWYVFWGLLVLTLMRPEIVQTPQYTKQYGYDLLLAVDLSRSMSALDFAKHGSRITRLEAVKEVVDKFVQQRQGDRLGLIVFAAAAYPYVPLTFDIASVSQQLQQLTVGMAGDSTALGDAIGLAVKNLQHRKGERILILLTDGEDNASSIPPIQAAKLAAKHKIKIYTIGVGSNGMVPIRDNDGNLVVIGGVLDEKLLKEIANLTGGIYSRATTKYNLEKIYQQIDKLEQHESQSKVVIIRTSLHCYSLGCALLVLLCLLIMYKRYLKI